MKFTVDGFNQRVLCSYGIDCIESIILRWFVDFADSGKMVKRLNPEDNIMYSWVNYQAIIDDLPYIQINNKTTIARRMGHLVEVGILKHWTCRQGGCYSMYAINPEHYINLIDDKQKVQDPMTQKSDPMTQKSDPMTQKSDPMTQKSEQNTRLLYPSIISNNTTSASLEESKDDGNKKYSTEILTNAKDIYSHITNILSMKLPKQEFMSICNALKSIDNNKELYLTLWEFASKDSFWCDKIKPSSFCRNIINIKAKYDNQNKEPINKNVDQTNTIQRYDEGIDMEQALNPNSPLYYLKQTSPYFGKNIL